MLNFNNRFSNSTYNIDNDAITNFDALQKARQNLIGEI